MNMLTTEERQVEFVKLVQKMRTAQKDLNAWVRSPAGRRSQAVLEEAKAFLEEAKCCERQVDRALRRIERAKNEPFGYHRDE